MCNVYIECFSFPWPSQCACFMRIMHICVVLCLGPPVYRLDLSLIESIIHRTPVTSTFFSQFWSEWNRFLDAVDKSKIHKSLFFFSLSLLQSPNQSFPSTCWLDLFHLLCISLRHVGSSRAPLSANLSESIKCPRRPLCCFSLQLLYICFTLQLQPLGQFWQVPPPHPVQSLMLSGASWVLDISMLVCCVVLWWTSWSVVAKCWSVVTKWSQSKTYYINLADKETTASDVEWKMKF